MYGTVLYILGCLKALLASTHQMQYHFPPQVVTIKNVSRYCKCPYWCWWGWECICQNRPWLRTTGSTLVWLCLFGLKYTSKKIYRFLMIKHQIQRLMYWSLLLYVCIMGFNNLSHRTHERKQTKHVLVLNLEQEYKHRNR